MAVADDDGKIIYACSGVTTYPVPFPFLDDADILVYRETAGGVQTLLTTPADYTITGAGDPTGSIETVATYSDGKLVILREVDYDQQLDLVTGDGFRPDTLEAQLDRMVMQTQQLRRKVESSVRISDTNTSDPSLEIPSPTARRALVWNAGGTALENSTYDPDAFGDTEAARDAALAAQAAAEAAEAGAAAILSSVTFADLTEDTAPQLDDMVITYDTSAAGNKKARLSSFPHQPFRNRVHNGCFRIAQRATTFTSTAPTSGANNDDTYTLDRWYILSDGNDIVDVTQETSVVPTGSTAAIRLDVETVNKKFGIAQIIENVNCADLIGGAVTLSFQAKVSSTTKLDNVKAAIVAWSGTLDTVTSDIISAWGIEGTNPTLIANATYENTPANLNVTTNYQKFTVTATVDTASAANIILFIWSDVTDTTLGDFLYIGDVQLEKGAYSSPFERRPVTLELEMCRRYLHVVGNGYVGNVDVALGYASSTTDAAFFIPMAPPLRGAPTGASYGTFLVVEAGGVENVGTVSSVSGSTHTAQVGMATTGIVAGQAIVMRKGVGSDARIVLSSEM